MRTDKLDKVIVNSVVSTLCAILALCAIAFGLAVWLYPSTMMHVSYAVGNDSGAMKYARRAYNRTGEIYYIAYATEVAIGMDDVEDIERYAEEFIADEKFSEYCREIDLKMQAAGSYRQYVYGQLAVAEYAQGEKSDAKLHAKEGIGDGFEVNNAFVALLFAAMEAGDSATVNELTLEMQGMQLPDGEQKNYLEQLLAALAKLS